MQIIRPNALNLGCELLTFVQVIRLPVLISEAGCRLAEFKMVLRDELSLFKGEHALDLLFL